MRAAASRRAFTTCTQCRSSSRSASAHLRSLAEQEEASQTGPKASTSSLPTDESPWTGEERLQDTVLRMLVDKYKPLRIQGWEKRLQQPTKKSNDESSDFHIIPTRGDDAPSKPRLPWEFEIKAPKHHTEQPSMRYGPPASHLKRSATAAGKRKVIDKAARVTAAKEASFDYGSAGDRKRSKGVEQYQSENRRPIGDLSSWTNLVEDRIDRARQEGLFKSVAGRHKPFQRDSNESNPYIDRTDFLMNRIIQRQGAAPPWIVLQQEVDAHLDTFRKNLREAWTKRAVRSFGLKGVGFLTPSVIDSVSTFRDPDWNRQERGYHEASLKAVNEQLRIYNAIAPYPVRRAPYSLDVELLNCYADCVPIIQSDLRERMHSGGRLKQALADNKGSPRQGLGFAEREEAAVHETMWSAFKRVCRQMVQ